MNDEVFFILLALLVVIGLPILAISAFVMVIGLRRRVAVLERKLGIDPYSLTAPQPPAQTATAAAAAVLPAEPGVSAPPAASGPAATPDTAEPAPAEPAAATAEPTEPAVSESPGAQPTQPPEEEIPASTAPSAAPPATPSPGRKESLEEALGARWAVWVGGVALALGGVFLVRYSIEAGLIGPLARIVAGLIFSAGLLAAGEWLRRRDLRRDFAGLPGAQIPGILTAAGTVALFGTVYAAYALYDFIGPAVAFVVLGAIGVLAMAAAALHGPWLAGLGLVGAFGTPILVATQTPNVWALVIYLAVVTAAAFVLARLRLWLWLAIAASIADLLWGFIIADDFGSNEPMAAVVHLLIAAGLVIGLLGVDPHRRDGPDEPFDLFALAVMVGVAFLALFTVDATGFGITPILAALAVAAAMLLAALALPALAPAAGIAALLAIGLAVAWPVLAQSLAEPIRVVPNLVEFGSQMPEAASLYAMLFAAAGLALLAGTTLAIERRADLRTRPAIALALAGVAGPILLLAVTYFRLTSFTANLVFGAIGLALGGLLALTTARFLKQEAADGSGAATVAASIHAAAATAALALSLTMTLAGSSLTLAFALAALGAAWVAMLRPLAALRWAAVALTALVIARSGGAWTIIGEVMTVFPTWSDIALRVALPAAAIGLGGWFLRRRLMDPPAAFLDSAAIILGAAAGCLSIRLFMQGPDDALAAPVGLLEAGLYVLLFLAMAIGFARGLRIGGSIVHRIAAPVSAALSLAMAAGWLLGHRNPLLTGAPVEGGALFNELAAALAGPALLAALLHRSWTRLSASLQPGTLQSLAAPVSWVAGGLSVALTLVYLTAETRFLMRGGDMSFLDVTAVESYAYSAVWLVFGILLLAGGLVLGSKGARAASAVVILLTVAKVFLIDMSDLEGVWRALSFIGLGLVLIGIGLVYQRLLFGSSGRKTDE